MSSNLPKRGARGTDGSPAAAVSGAPARHRRSYFDPALAGRDRYTVHALAPWIEEQVTAALGGSQGVTVLDVGCGEQPWHSRIEELGAAYLGLDVEQNSTGSVAVIAAIDRPLPDPWPCEPAPPFPVVLCTEVMEHVADWTTAWANLELLVQRDGVLVLTVPFFFPLHCEPQDYFRATPHALEAAARAHGFEVVRIDRLGGVLEVLATVLADLSILPNRPTLERRVKARALRFGRSLLLGALAARWWQRGVIFNSNTHLSSAAVLRRL